MDSVNVSYENAKKNYERNQKLFDTGAISQSQLEELQTALAGAESSYKSAKVTLDILNKGETQETINVAASQVKEAQAALDIAKTQLGNTVIVSPISGIVTAKNINTGELAAAGSTLIDVVNSDELVGDGYLPAAYINRIKIGQEVVIKLTGSLMCGISWNLMSVVAARVTQGVGGGSLHYVSWYDDINDYFR